MDGSILITTFAELLMTLEGIVWSGIEKCLGYQPSKKVVRGACPNEKEEKNNRKKNAFLIGKF